MTEQQQETADSTIAHEATVEAQVTPAGQQQAALTPLWHPDGRAIEVPEAAVPALLSDGWTRDSHDIDATAAELALLFDSAKGAVAEWARDAQATQVISTGVEAATYVAERAMSDLVHTYGRLAQAIHARFPVQQRDEPTTEATVATEEVPTNG